jgi:1,4-dihydroxy-2-naphthoate octaprenyltransferase
VYYLIVAVLFLKPSIKKEHLPAQIGRFIFGLLISFFLFYVFNADRSISFILSMLWLPAIFQIVLCFKNLTGTTGNYKKIKRKQEYSNSNIENIFATLMIFVIFFCFAYNAQPYITGQAKKLAAMVPVKESTDKLPKIDAEHVIVISPETAYYEMQKMIGTLPNPSIYKIGELGITMTKDGACYVAPIEVDGLFVSLTNSSIPGVMYVSAEKPTEAKIINIPANVADSLSFNHNLQRYLRKYEPNKILFQANAELDDEGNPYFVGSYGSYKYGRKGAVVEGVLLMSFKDGKVTDYKIDKVPSWVDEVYPADIAENYNEYFGTLKDGLLNKIFAKNGVHVPTEWSSEATVNGLQVNSSEVTGVIDADGKMKWFTDHTNTSNSSTTMTGYTLMDMRTGNMIYYKTSGYINGKGAMNAVDKTMGANKSNWAPVQPIFYNLFGTEAWIVPVVNKTDGALVKVAVVAAQNGYTVLEDSKDSALEAFKNAIAYGKVQDISNKNANSVKAEEKTITGKVSRINEVTEEGNTIFYVKLENDKKIYMVTKSAGVDIVLTKEGDTVEIKYLDIKDNDIVSTTQIVNDSIK